MRNFNQHRIWYCCNWLVSSATIPGSVASIKKTNDLLKDSYSDMAIRNLLADLVRQLNSYKPVPVPRDSPDVIVATRQIIAEVLERANAELGAHRPSIGRYKKVLCLGYCVKTVGNKYTGKNDDRKDLMQRVECLEDAINKAHGLAGSFATETDVLKIFMAPEFFFRGKNGAYEHEVVHGDGQNLGIMDLLRKTLDRPAYKDWLFVLGTTVVASKSTEFTCDVCAARCDFWKYEGKTRAYCTADSTHQVSEKTLGAMVENVALIKKEDVLHTVTKELISDMDYRPDNKRKNKALKNKGKVRLGGKLLKVERSSSGGADKKPSKFSDERMGGNIFTIDGITFGLEVCLDHTASVSSGGNGGRLQHAANIQVQLIPSGGMFIKKLRTVPNGIVFNVDGDTPHVTVVAGDKTDVQRSIYNKNSDVMTSLIAKNAPKWSELKAKGQDAIANNEWSINPAPQVGPARQGRVVMHGPYNIP